MPAASVGKLLTPTLKTPSEYEDSILLLFALHRIATPYDIMATFPGLFRYHSTAIRHLNRLCNDGFLTRHDLGNNVLSYAYNITHAGYVRCRDIPGIDLTSIPYSYEPPSGRQSEHDLLITKVAIEVCQCLANQSDARLLDQGRYMLQYRERVTTEDGDEVSPFTEFIPDYWYLKKDNDGLMVVLFQALVGVDSVSGIKGTVLDCQTWAETEAAQRWLINKYAEHGAEHPEPEFEVHCMLDSRNWKHTDSWKERTIIQQTFHVPPEMQARFRTTTKTAFDEALAEGQTVNAPIWHWGFDFTGLVRQKWSELPQGQRTRFVDLQMQNADTYPIFR